MSTRSEQLFAGVFAALQFGLPPLVAAQNIHRENTFQFDADSELPAVSVHKSGDLRVSESYRDTVRSQAIVVRVYAKGETSIQGDNIRQRVQQIMQAFFNDPVLRPLAVEEQSCEIDDALLNGSAFEFTLNYEIRYSQNEAAL